MKSTSFSFKSTTLTGQTYHREFKEKLIFTHCHLFWALGGGAKQMDCSWGGALKQSMANLFTLCLCSPPNTTPLCPTHTLSQHTLTVFAVSEMESTLWYFFLALDEKFSKLCNGTPKRPQQNGMFAVAELARSNNITMISDFCLHILTRMPSENCVSFQLVL